MAYEDKISSKNKAYLDLRRYLQKGRFFLITAGADWSAPTRLGPHINSARYRDVAPFVAFDDRTMLISSKRPGGLGQGTFDIYMATPSKAAE